jgi:hypothetical protein
MMRVRPVGSRAIVFSDVVADVKPRRMGRGVAIEGSAERDVALINERDQADDDGVDARCR